MAPIQTPVALSEMPNALEIPRKAPIATVHTMQAGFAKTAFENSKVNKNTNFDIFFLRKLYNVYIKSIIEVIFKFFNKNKKKSCKSLYLGVF